MMGDVIYKAAVDGEEMAEVYEGDRPYIFVCYESADCDAALPIVRALEDEGYRVWYDGGIEPGTNINDCRADHIRNCACVVALISKSWVSSERCKIEVDDALNLGKVILPIYLEDVELRSGLQMRLGGVQALFWHAYATDAEFNERLFSVKVLDRCLTEEGKRSRGVRKRSLQLDGRATVDAADKRGLFSDFDTISCPVESECARLETGVMPKLSIADYSWSELKSISRAMADAAYDAEGLVIARRYGLVDASGNLSGDQKPLTLYDGTKTVVRILGFRHDRLTSGGVAGITFEFVGMPKDYHMNTGRTNAGGWEKSEMRRWLNTTFLALLPDDLRLLVETVKKSTNNKGQILKGDTSPVTGTDDKLWILSMCELYGKLSGQVGWSPWFVDAYDEEGCQYQLYANKAVSVSNYGYCRAGESNSYRWLRSPYADGSSKFIGVSRSGSWCGGSASYDCGVSPCFCV